MLMHENLQEYLFHLQFQKDKLLETVEKFLNRQDYKKEVSCLCKNIQSHQHSLSCFLHKQGTYPYSNPLKLMYANIIPLNKCIKIKACFTITKETNESF